VENINADDAKIAAIPDSVPEVTETHFSPNNPPWGSPMAVFVWLASFALIAIVPVLFLIPYLLSQNVNFSDQEKFVEIATKDPTSLLIQIGAVIPAHLITLLLAWLVITNYRKYSFTEMLGWKWGGFKWWHALLLLIAVFTLAYLMVSIFGEQDNDLMKILRSSRAMVYLVAVMATFSAPIVEEVVYRGVLYSAFQRTFNIPVAVFLVTLVFAGVHFPQYWGDYSTLITLTFLSLVITMIRVKTDNLLPCILFHFLINGIQSLLLVLQPLLPESMNTTKPAAEALIHTVWNAGLLYFR
ncbi:MAG: CPBP family intramembrane metalloprotease, partial [Acidobacteria bacterium]|nr:CPBP family intramembrane metalloprotease [Acidobacteriota bacterium]